MPGWQVCKYLLWVALPRQPCFPPAKYSVQSLTKICMQQILGNFMNQVVLVERAVAKICQSLDHLRKNLFLCPALGRHSQTTCPRHQSSAFTTQIRCRTDFPWRRKNKILRTSYSWTIQKVKRAGLDTVEQTLRFYPNVKFRNKK